MLVCRLKKDDDAVFFVHEIGKVVDLTLIALRLVIFADRSSRKCR